MTIYNVLIQLGLLEFLKLMMGILQYQPSSEKTFSLDVPSTQLNELVFMRNPMTFPKIYSEINPLQIPKEKSKSNARIKSIDFTTAWSLLHMTNNKLFTLKCNQKIPNWTGFRKLTSLKVSAPIIIGNCRTIPAYTMMLNLKKILSWNWLTCIL